MQEGKVVVEEGLQIAEGKREPEKKREEVFRMPLPRQKYKISKSNHFLAETAVKREDRM